jgi:hypothetical protein
MKRSTCCCGMDARRTPRAGAITSSWTSARIGVRYTNAGGLWGRCLIRCVDLLPSSVATGLWSQLATGTGAFVATSVRPPLDRNRVG